MPAHTRRPQARSTYIHAFAHTPASESVHKSTYKHACLPLCRRSTRSLAPASVRVHTPARSRTLRMGALHTLVHPADMPDHARTPPVQADRHTRSPGRPRGCHVATHNRIRQQRTRPQMLACLSAASARTHRVRTPACMHVRMCACTYSTSIERTPEHACPNACYLHELTQAIISIHTYICTYPPPLINHASALFQLECKRPPTSAHASEPAAHSSPTRPP
jgi:hypothetical protein